MIKLRANYCIRTKGEYRWRENYEVWQWHELSDYLYSNCIFSTTTMWTFLKILCGEKLADQHRIFGLACCTILANVRLPRLDKMCEWSVWNKRMKKPPYQIIRRHNQIWAHSKLKMNSTKAFRAQTLIRLLHDHYR